MKKEEIPRRKFLENAALVGGLLASGIGKKILAAETNQPSPSKTPAIDRFALVTRHNPVMRKIELFAPLPVGNGEFAFTGDVTGFPTDGSWTVRAEGFNHALFEKF